jgi:hypothetical protein
MALEHCIQRGRGSGQRSFKSHGTDRFSPAARPFPHRLIAIAGRPLSDRQQRDQTERIFMLSHNPEEQRKFEQIRRKCTGQILKLLAKRTCV